MTREEAIKMLEYIRHVGNGESEYKNDAQAIALDIAIKALEQQPCDDCISRQAAQAKIKNICDEYRLSYEDGERKAATGGSAYALGHAFDDLPPVTPQPKMGRWIDIQYFKADDTYYRPKCPFCSIEPKEYSNCCPNCGAKMQEGEE